MKNRVSKYLIFFFLIIILLSVFNLAASAAELEHRFDIALGTISGQTQYEINGYNSSNNYSFKSLLEFPLDVEVLNFNYQNNFTSQRLNIGGLELDITKNINEDAGTFKDSDWLSLSGLGTKDIYGTTKTRVDDLTMLDLNINSGWKPMSYDLVYTLYIGYKRDDYSITAYDGVQRVYTAEAAAIVGETKPIDGEAIKYEALYEIPYLGAGFKTNNQNNWQLKADIFYSSWVDMEDKDRHLLREDNLVGEGSGEGNSLLINADLFYNLSQRSSAFLNIKYNKTEVDGIQYQYSTAGTGIVDYSAEEEYFQYNIGMGFDF